MHLREELHSGWQRQDSFTEGIFPSASQTQPCKRRCPSVAVCDPEQGVRAWRVFPAPAAPCFQPERSQLLRLSNSAQIASTERYS